MDLLIDVLYYLIIFFGICFLVEMVYHRNLSSGQAPNKIDKIIALRAKTGLSLRECKERIDKEFP